MSASLLAPPALVHRCEATTPIHVWLQLDLHEMWKPPPSKDVELSPDEVKPLMSFGQISAVCKGHNGDIWVFHRGEVVWDLATFDPKKDDVRIANPEAFIQAPAVVQLDQVRPALLCIDSLRSTGQQEQHKTKDYSLAQHSTAQHNRHSTVRRSMLNPVCTVDVRNAI